MYRDGYEHEKLSDISIMINKMQNKISRLEEKINTVSYNLNNLTNYVNTLLNDFNTLSNTISKDMLSLNKQIKSVNNSFYSLKNYANEIKKLLHMSSKSTHDLINKTISINDKIIEKIDELSTDINNIYAFINSTNNKLSQIKEIDNTIRFNLEKMKEENIVTKDEIKSHMKNIKKSIDSLAALIVDKFNMSSEILASILKKSENNFESIHDSLKEISGKIFIQLKGVEKIFLLLNIMDSSFQKLSEKNEQKTILNELMIEQQYIHFLDYLNTLSKEIFLLRSVILGNLKQKEG